MVLLQSTILLTATSGKGFVFDDVGNLADAAASDLSLGFLTREIFGHLAPGHRLAFWLDQRFFDSSYLAMVVFLTIVVVLSTLVMYRVLRLLGVARNLSLALTFLYAVSPLYVPMILFPSAGLHSIPSITLTLVSLWAFLKYAEQDRLRWVLLSMAAFVVALLFYEKPAFIPLYVAFVWIVHQRAFEWRKAARALRRIDRLLMAYILVDLLWLLPQRIRPAAIVDPTVAQMGEFVWAGWARGFVPGYLGFGPASGLGGHEFSNDAASVVAWSLVLITQGVFVALVVYTLRRARKSALVWLFLGLAVLLHLGVVAAVRAADLGPTAAYRFSIETLFLFSMAAGVALTLAVQTRSKHENQAEARPGNKRAQHVVAVLVAVVLVVASMLSTLRMRETWPDGQQGADLTPAAAPRTTDQ